MRKPFFIILAVLMLSLLGHIAGGNLEVLAGDDLLSKTIDRSPAIVIIEEDNINRSLTSLK